MLFRSRTDGTEIDATGQTNNIGGPNGYNAKQLTAMVYSTYQDQITMGLPIGRAGVKGHSEIDTHSGKIDPPAAVVDLIGEQIAKLHAELTSQDSSQQ